MSCTLCSLHKEVKHVLIPFRGKLNSPEIMFVGIAPAREEDYQGKNFVGPAGRLLFEILESLEIPTDQCGFDNVVHCATLRDGIVVDPTEEQLVTCSAYLYAKIRQVKPKVIVTLGNIPTREFLGADTFISDVHGRDHDVIIGGQHYKLIPTFHPSSVLRGNAEFKKDIKDDILHAWRSATGVYYSPNIDIIQTTGEAVDRILDIGDRFLAKKLRFCATDSETNSIILENNKREKEGVELIDKMLYSPEGQIGCFSLATVENVRPGDFKTYREATGFTVPAFHKDSPVDMFPVTKALRKVFGRKREAQINLQVPMSAHNAKYDFSWYKEKLGFMPILFHDTMLGHTTIYGNSLKHGLENILFKELLFERYKHDTDGALQNLAPAERHFCNLPLELIGTRCGIDTVGCGILTVTQLVQIRGLKRQVLNELLRKASESFTKTELRGNFVDMQRLEHYLKRYPEMMDEELEYMGSFPQVQVWKAMHPKKTYKPHYYEDRSQVMYRIFCLPTEFSGDEEARYKKNDTEEDNPYWSTNETAQVSLINHCRVKVRKKQIDKATGKVMINDKGLPVEYEEYVPAPFTGDCTCRAMDPRLTKEEDHTPENYSKLGINPHGPALSYLTHQRTYSKIRTVYRNYLNKMLRYIRPDEWHTENEIDEQVRSIVYSYLLHYVSSGRLSTRDFPMHTHGWHSDSRRCFVSKWFMQGGLLMSADYSQLELRIVAALAMDMVLIQAYKEGKDIHRMTASACWRVAEELVTSAMRRYCKTISFRIIYGGGAAGIAAEIGMSVKEVAAIIRNWLDKYSGVAQFIVDRHQEAELTGQVLSVLGRLFHLPDAMNPDERDKKKQKALRESQNLPVQGTGSDVTMTSYNLLYDTFEDHEMRTRPWLMVHDANEIDIFPDEDELYVAYQYTKHYMEVEVLKLYPWLVVPMKTDFELGARWDGSPSVLSFTPESLKVYGRVPFVLELVSQMRKFSKFDTSFFGIAGKQEVNFSPRLTKAQMVAVEKGEEIVIKKSYEGDSGGDFDTGLIINFKKPLKSVVMPAA